MPTLPNLEDVPECPNDKILFETILGIFKNYRENEPSIPEFENELLWLFNFIDNRASNKPYVLFECGFIFLQDKVAINLSQIAITVCLINIQISQRIKSWSTHAWDLASKKLLLSNFRNCDLRSWSLRKIPKTNPINEFINSRISLQTSHPVNEANAIPPPRVHPVTVLNTEIFDSRRIYNFTVYSDPPKQWIFNQEPKRNFILT